jgi:hypothetical protein
MNLIQLKKLLKRHGIPFHEWENGESKKLHDLLDEVTAGETTFRIIDDELIRCIAPAVIDVYYPLSNTTLHHLREIKQIFTDGRVKNCNRDTSVSEKMKSEETPEQGARRGLFEELGFKKSSVYSLIQVKQDCVTTGTTRSFPGLPTFRRRTYFVCVITRHLYKAHGYIEIQPGKKKVCFEWEPIKVVHAQPFKDALLSKLKHSINLK